MGVERMSEITIKQAKTEDIPIIENILLDTVNWLNEMEQPLWGAGEVSWDALSKNYQIGDFYIAYSDRKPSGCMALVDYDPFFWPDVKKGESLFIHKFAVTKTARKSGVADALMDFFKKQGVERRVKTLRLDTHALRPKLRAFYERHGFVFVKVKVLKGDRHTAFYIYTLPDSVLAQNKSSWNTMADSWFGVTALPTYGCLCPNEDELHLFPDLNDKKMLDIGCGSGHSLKWCGDHGSTELWGLDISDRQLENAGKYLRDNAYNPKLFCSPMEQNPGLPQGYFDVVYSIYAIGWTVDLQGTFNLIASYLKSGGVFIFSWDHPFMHCVEVKDGQLIFSGSYYEAEPFSYIQRGNPVTLLNRRLSDYINALSAAGFTVERVVEETDKTILERDAEFSSDYYAPSKAKRFPLSLIVKARKL
jgi:SAM-dependent methyltransferase/GNAT superfamily N-acetyltransferase